MVRIVWTSSGQLLIDLNLQAYDKYQERKANSIESPSPELLEYQANNEIVEKAGLLPPSYDEVVANRAEIPESKGVSEKEIKGEKNLIEDLTESESIREVPNGLRAPYGYDVPVQAHYDGSPASRGCCGRQNDAYASRCEQKRAEKMARKAEKQAAKLANAQVQM